MKRESIPVTATRMIALASVAALTAVTIPCAQAQTFSVVHNFTGGSDGGNPVDGFTMSETGILYGTASSGGASGYGVVLKVGAKGAETVLHSFAGGSSDGATPNGGVLLKGREIFGTTTAGGASGLGTVFKLAGTTESVLYSFAGGTDGAVPIAGLVMDPAGNLY